MNSLFADLVEEMQQDPAHIIPKGPSIIISNSSNERPIQSAKVGSYTDSFKRKVGSNNHTVLQLSGVCRCLPGMR